MRRILFVDDEPECLAKVQRMVRPQLAWETAFAPSGEVALALLEASPFDVVVSALRMRGMDGARFLTCVQERFPQVVRIVLSSTTELEAALRTVPVAHQVLGEPCDADMLRVAVERACRLNALLSDESIRRIVGSMGELPSLPRVYEGLTRALADPDASLRSIARIVEQDVGISAKILQLVNSAFFGLAQPMTSIQGAVSYLGISTLKNLVLSVEVFHAFKPDRRLEGFSFEALQYHAQLTARITSCLPVPRHLADATVLAGMLHDVGKLILAWKLPEEFARVLADSQSNRRPLYQVEEEHFGVSHAEIGAALLGLWGLPYTLVEAVAFHHAPTRIPHQGLDPLAAVYIANLLARECRAESAVSPNDDGTTFDSEYLGSLGVAEMLPDWRARALEIAAETSWI